MLGYYLYEGDKVVDYITRNILSNLSLVLEYAVAIHICVMYFL